MTKDATLRVARPTDQLDEVVRFYSQGLGLTVLGSFRDHAGFDGTMLGRSGAAYHLEFTAAVAGTAEVVADGGVPSRHPGSDDDLRRPAGTITSSMPRGFAKKSWVTSSVVSSSLTVSPASR